MPDLQALLADLASGDDEKAEAAALAFSEQSAAALPHLEALLNAADEDTRWWAARAVAEVDGPQVTALLVKTLQDSSAGVRQCAALGLRKFADPQTIPFLIDLLSDPDPLCVTLAGDTLTVIGAPSVPALLEVLQKGSHLARLGAVRSLALIGDQRATPALMSALQEDSALMEYWANEGLDRLGFGMTFFQP